jgi:fused signal recognition particle receptor
MPFDPALLAELDPMVLGGAVAAVVATIAVVLGLRRPRPGVEAPATEGEPPAAPVGLGARLWDALAGTRAVLGAGLERLRGGAPVDEGVLEPLEEALLRSDVGLPTTERLLADVRQALRGGETDGGALRAVLVASMRALLRSVDRPVFTPPAEGPTVLLVVGVNGSGKTTSIGKLAHMHVQQGRSVVLAAADTYRAAAVEQLAVWAERSGAELIQKPEGADPASVAHAALEHAVAKGADVVIVDTAGRLQTARPLMEQLTKVRKVIDRKVPGAPHATWLVIDGTMGQNALSQARAFHEATPLTAVIVTKLDGTAKGGMILAIAAELGLPVAFIGIGEKLEDLRPFDADAFISSLVDA